VKARIAAAVLLWALAFAATIASAQQDGPFQCIAVSVVGGQVTMYVSQMIPSGGAKPSAAVNSAWGDYVKSTYHLDAVSTAICNQMPADPSLQQRVISAEQNQWQKRNMRVVQVNWQPGQKQNSAPNSNANPYAAVAPPAGDAPKDGQAAGDAKNAPPPADVGPQPRASYCYSDEKKPTIYFSDAFDTADLPDPHVWVNAFVKMLVAKYNYKGTVTCKDSDTIFNAQGAIRDYKDTLAGKQFVDTDWTYEPPAPGDAAPAADDSSTPPPAPPKKKAAAKPPQN
jgi:hypothetical protein